MDTKSNVNSSANLANIPIVEDGIVYVAIKGSLYANDCSAFGLGQEEIRALTKRFPGSVAGVVNGITIKATVLSTINALAQLGYKVVSSTGEAEVTWTLQRDI